MSCLSYSLITAIYFLQTLLKISELLRTSFLRLLLLALPPITFGRAAESYDYRYVKI